MYRLAVTAAMLLVTSSIGAQAAPSQSAGNGGKSGPSGAALSVATECPAETIGGRLGPVEPSDKNTIVFNHRHLTVTNKRLLVLEADDGGYFQVLFDCTAPWYFNYTITADREAGAEPGSAGGTAFEEFVQVDPARLVAKGVTMRHDASFMRYHVSARLRPGVPPAVRAETAEDIRARAERRESVEALSRRWGMLRNLPAPVPPAEPAPAAELYGVEFDVWVVTAPEWKLGVIGGVGFSPMTDEKFYIKSLPDNRSAFERAPDVALDQWRTDVIALANAYYSRTYLRFLNFGAAFGIGTSGGNARYFLGPSFVVGKYFVFSPGISIGSVVTAPIGQALGEPPINGANTLNTLSTRRVVRPSLAIGFTWIDRKDQFAAALASASASGSIGSCVTSVAPTELKFDEAGEKQITVTAGDDCSWVATLQQSNSGFEVKSGGAGKGKGTITIAVSAQGDKPRADTLNIVGPFGSAARTVKLTQAAGSCVESVGDGKEIGADGKTQLTVAIKAPSTCSWTAAAEGNGFSVKPVQGTGAGSVTVAVPVQTTDDQTGTLSVIGPTGATPRKLTIKQPKKAQ